MTLQQKFKMARNKIVTLMVEMKNKQLEKMVERDNKSKKNWVGFKLNGNI